ncbi:hypothetical protein QO190_02325 [Cloacibacterium sp. Arc13]|uniref:hypothetical protein n=1 Tax=unclassified Cloacibacterium TaxID=2620870 RepID=UPI00352C9547
MSKAQVIEDGTYIGFEQNPFCYSKDCTRDYNENRLKRNELAYKIVLQVKGSDVSLSKLSVTYFSKRKQIIDSTKGGYFLYKNIDVSSDRIFASIDKCKYCKKGGCGVRKYNYIFYHFIKAKDGILLKNDYNENIFLKKIKK